jgi:hypothetical protein
MIYPDDRELDDPPVEELTAEDVAEIRGDEDVHRLQEEGYLRTGVSIETALMRRGLDRMEREEC